MASEANPAPDATPLPSDFSAMLNVFIDAATTVKKVGGKWFWVWPVVIVSIVSVLVGLGLTPISLRVVQQNPPAGVSAEQMQRAASMSSMFAYISVFVTPVFVLLKLLVLSWLLSVACTVLDVRATFRSLFNLMAACSLIPMLQSIATYVVIRAKGDDIQSMTELMPPFGLDIFIREEGSKLLLAALNFFSIFEIWYLVILAFGLAYLAGCSRRKAFGAITPVWVVPLLFSIGIAAIRR